MPLLRKCPPGLPWYRYMPVPAQMLTGVVVFTRGYVATPMSDTLEVQRGSLPVGMAALGRKGDPAEVGQLIAFLLSRESSFITGSVYTIDGGWLC